MKFLKESRVMCYLKISFFLPFFFKEFLGFGKIDVS